MDEVRFIEVLREVEGVGPVELLETDPFRRVKNHHVLVPVLCHLPDGTREIRDTGFTFCLN